jgi:hypothetical protein
MEAGYFVNQEAYLEWSGKRQATGHLFANKTSDNQSIVSNYGEKKNYCSHKK